MFSQESRCLYRKNQLAEVICQLRFPEILLIETGLPAEFQNAVRSDFPIYTVKQELSPPKLTVKDGSPVLQKPNTMRNHQFSSADGTWRINLTSKFISLTCSHYRCWEEFAGKLDNLLSAFIKIYTPAYFERLGLRYLNVFSRQSLDAQNTPFRLMFTPCYLGPLAHADIPVARTSRCSIDCDIALQQGCRAKIHAGPGTVKFNGKENPELKFILDLDLYSTGTQPVSHSVTVLQALHDQAFPIFRGAITDLLHNSMEPETI